MLYYCACILPISKLCHTGAFIKLLIYVILVQFCLNNVMHIINFFRFLFKYIFLDGTVFFILVIIVILPMFLQWSVKYFIKKNCWLTYLNENYILNSVCWLIFKFRIKKWKLKEKKLKGSNVALYKWQNSFFMTIFAFYTTSIWMFSQLCTFG